MSSNGRPLEEEEDSFIIGLFNCAVSNLEYTALDCKVISE
jgi:hypothetical protein